MACWDVILRKIHFFMKIGFTMASIKIFSQHLFIQKVSSWRHSSDKSGKIFAKYRKNTILRAFPRQQALERWMVSRWEEGWCGQSGKRNDKSRPFPGHSLFLEIFWAGLEKGTTNPDLFQFTYFFEELSGPVCKKRNNKMRPFP